MQQKLKKVLVSVPDNLLAQMDKIASDEQCNRSECLREAMRLYIEQRQKMILHQQLKQAYEAMGALNLEWSEAVLPAENQSFEAYEKLLAGLKGHD